MYAIIISGGKQYKVVEGEEVLLEKMKGTPGDKVQLGDVIFLSANGDKVLDKDELSKVKVKAEILEQTRDDKIIVFKYKPKKGYRRKQGHRQFLTRLRVDDIDFPGKPPKAKEAPKPKAAEKAPEKATKAKAKTESKPKAKAASEKKPAAAKQSKKAEKPAK